MNAPPRPLQVRARKPEPPPPLTMKCPRCEGQNYFGRVDLPTVRKRPCPNCGSKLVPVK